NVSWAFSLLVLLENLVATLTGSKLAGRIAPALLFFSGGLGFAWAFKDMTEHAKGVSDFLSNLPRDYTIGDKFRWGNTMVVLFMTQRSLLLGMPLVVLVLGGLWRIFNCPTDVETADKAEKKDGSPIPEFVQSNGVAIAIGLLAGMLPLIHLHSLAALFVVTAFLFAFRLDRWKAWIAFGIATAVVAVPFLAWAMAGSASESSKFFEFFFGWDKKPDESFVWFWIKNTGILFPMIGVGLWLFYKDKTTTAEVKEGEEKPKAAFPRLILFYIPFVALFVISNIAKLAPWQWDNIKILAYWFLLSIPFVAYALAWLWEKNQALKAVAIACLLVLTLSGGLDVFRTMAGVTKFRVFDADAMKMAELVKAQTPKNALFLNAPTFNTATVLTGRQSLMRFTAHLTSHGIDPGTRENDVKQIYQGGAAADALLAKHNIDYVLVSPEERNTLKANEEYFKKFPLAVQAGEYRVYKIK
ncbi:MAG: hypothetical protein ABL959_19040, partial [Pyrinomonadaceae bacterium]